MVGTRSFDRQDRYILHPNTSRGGLRGNTSDPDGFVGRYSGLLAPAGRRSSNFDGYSTPGSRYYSVDVSIVGSGYETPASDVADENESIRQSYMSGQIADVLKKSLWWNVVGVLLTYLTKDYYVIPLSHIVLNISFLICSLFSDFLAETMSMRALLCFTVLSRIVIWIFIFPLCYIFFGRWILYIR
uniref:Uncharacterized protein n=1 Tax=Babesia bovis TaxID=5865 RepID=A7ANC3_BABBO|eukprot:XP_001611625.1 hypothetical protein [Babesia bovis T2Bo]